MVYLLSTEGHGLSAEKLAWEINSRQLHVRKDGAPVGVSQIWALYFKYPEMFVRDRKLIRLIICSMRILFAHTTNNC